MSTESHTICLDERDNGDYGKSGTISKDRQKNKPERFTNCPESGLTIGEEEK